MRVFMKKFFLIFCLAVIFNISVPLCSYAEVVMFNLKTKKYHSVSCKWAKKCTVNCIKIDKKIAIRRGGIPCKVCGG